MGKPSRVALGKATIMPGAALSGIYSCPMSSARIVVAPCPKTPRGHLRLGSTAPYVYFAFSYTCIPVIKVNV